MTTRDGAPTMPAQRVTWSRIIAFLVLAFALPWTVWLSAVAAEHDIIGFHLPGGIALWTLMIPVVLVTAVSQGRAGLHTLAHRLVRWRVAPVWYVVALLGPLLLTAVSWAVGSAFTTIRPGSELGLGAAVGYFAFGILLFGLTEEPAWRGTALPWLQTRLSLLQAALLLGIIWGCWHAPLWWAADSSQADWPFLGFVVFATAESVLLAWVFVNAAGSVLLVALMHAATDAALAWSGVLDAGRGAFWVTCAVFVIAAAAVVARTGSALGGRPGVTGGSERSRGS